MGFFNSSLESLFANEVKIRKIEDFLELPISSLARAYPERLRQQTRPLDGIPRASSPESCRPRRQARRVASVVPRPKAILA